MGNNIRTVMIAAAAVLLAITTLVAATSAHAF